MFRLRMEISGQPRVKNAERDRLLFETPFSSRTGKSSNRLDCRVDRFGVLSPDLMARSRMNYSDQPSLKNA
jgi:hypothetical protein